MIAIFPVDAFGSPDQFKANLIRQRSGLEGVINPFTSQPLARHLPEMIVNQIEKASFSVRLPELNLP
jgi:hypothetical protein